MHSMRSRALVSVLAIVGAATVVGIAIAGIPDSGGVIHACYSGNGAKQNNGTPLNIIDLGTATCKGNSQEIGWGQVGPRGPKGDTGEQGDPGPAGPSAAYTNYGDGFHAIGAGSTQTVASVTVPAGSYVLSGVVHAIGADGSDFLQCNFVSTGTVHGTFAVLVDDGAEPMLADVTVGSTTNPIFLRCNAQNGTIDAAGQMIATRVGTVTASL